ncbi:MAG TPA: AAA family ATPase, partial [Anaerolineae bacterium]|nr:AAA family ATPase [Anaerolineae bacterium]
MATALATARAGQGQIQFVIGGAGRGKTSLVQEFARQALADDPDLVVITGNCHAHTGLGDPYLPFREALAMLTGEVEARWAGGQITRQAAHRLWALLPVTLPLLIDHAPDLIERFIPGRPLLDRAAALVSPESAWFKQLAGLVAERGRTGLEQQPLFRQTTAWLKAVAAQRPLLLILEDLHWIDSSSNALLFHLCRELWPNRVLLIGTYRPEAVALGRGEKLHPLAPILGELKRQHGDIWLDLASLSPAEGKAFVDAYLDTQPNQLSVAFRTALFRRTAGHPLFTVELLREMQARGDLRRNETGHWVEGETIDWHRLPAKVEGVIETRIAHLPDGLQSVLTIASVEGETFTAELVARVQQLDEWMIVQQMSRELEERHRLVTAQQLERVGSQRLSRYRFRHHLFQHYLYHRLAEAERVYLHEAVGWALASLYDGDTEAVAIKLAHHFEQAGLTEQATHYLLQAGRRANRLSAYQAAVDHLRRGLGLLATLPESLARHQRELDFQVALGVALMHLQGYAAPAVKEAYTRARALCEKMETTAQLFPVLYGLWAFYHVRAEHQAAREMGETWLRLAK